MLLFPVTADKTEAEESWTVYLRTHGWEIAMRRFGYTFFISKSCALFPGPRDQAKEGLPLENSKA